MKEPVIVQKNIKGKVRLEDKYDYTVNLTIGLAEGGDFYLVIDFIDLTMEGLKIVAQLSKLQRRLSIKSEIIDKEQYNITHIVVTKFSSNSNLAMTWECLSDDPSLYDNIVIE
ncbi:MAG: hypothetical protein IPJ81_06395 [Chitinophagaceae bacterium]|jgi:hypothetical protein|nr:hypothetical protein [Chitinophagaceae bacterium]